MAWLTRDRYPALLLALYALFWTAMAIDTPDRKGWLLENILVAIALPLIVWSYWRFRLSNVSYSLLFVFMCLHTIGSHWTYAQVPLIDWKALGFERNHYDRVVHFSFGLLLAYPIREMFHRVAHARGFWGYYLPLDVTLAFSAVYEIIEWLAAVIVDPAAGAAFLGSQGDEFDAVKDMALAGSGALITMLITAGIGWKYNRTFGAEMSASLSRIDPRPMGENSLRRWRAAAKKQKGPDEP